MNPGALYRVLQLLETVVHPTAGLDRANRPPPDTLAAGCPRSAVTPPDSCAKLGAKPPGPQGATGPHARRLGPVLSRRRLLGARPQLHLRLPARATAPVRRVHSRPLRPTQDCARRQGDALDRLTTRLRNSASQSRGDGAC